MGFGFIERCCFFLMAVSFWSGSENPLQDQQTPRVRELQSGDDFYRLPGGVIIRAVPSVAFVCLPLHHCQLALELLQFETPRLFDVANLSTCEAFRSQDLIIPA